MSMAPAAQQYQTFPSQRRRDLRCWGRARPRAELGPDAKGVAVGDKIMGSGGSAFAEYTLADHGRLFRAPSNMNYDEAATLPVALATMHNAVVTNGALKP